jgi:hypothetical protein
VSGSPEAEPRDALRAAVDLALGEDWQAAHEVAQRHEHDPLACWLHAVVHRMEGDLGNANYWYRRCGRSLREHVTTREELREIRAALEGAPRT